MERLIHAVNISREFQLGEVTVRALNGLDFDVMEGELLVILGPSGSGKSTLLNILGGIDTTSEGELWYGGEALHTMNLKALTAFRRQHVGFVFQFYNLMPNLTALENVEMAAEMSEHPLDPVTLMEQVGLSDRSSHYPSRMSGGQQQRVAIARALCKNPDLLLCDEPTGALDLASGEQVLRLLADFNKTYHKTVMIITHNQNIALIADRVFYLKDGKLDRIQVNEHPIEPEQIPW